MKRFLQLALGLVLCAAPLVAQNSAPDIAFDSNADLLKLPDSTHMGEAAGVATNSKGHIFAYTRAGAAHATVGTSRTFYKSGSRLFEFDQAGKFVREIGVGVYGFNNAQAVRIDPQDNIWVVDRGSTQVIKFDPDGRIQLVMSRKPEAIAVRAGAPGGGGGRGAAPEGRGGPPPEGRGVPAPAPPGWAPAAAAGVGVPAAICITPGAHQYMYVSNSNDAESLDNGEIYKMELDGKIVGKFGRAGRVPKEFNMVNAIDCRSENELFVAELGSWRVQKITLKPGR